MKELIEKLEKFAKRECWGDDEDFCAMDYCGGNFDDAYSGGVDDGETYLARVVLGVLKEDKYGEEIQSRVE